MLKKDRPIEVAKYIINNVIEESRRGQHITWAKNTIKSANHTIRRISRYYNIDRVERLIEKRKINVRRMSRNKRNQKQKRRIKFGIKVPNNVREALLFDRENKNTLRANAIKKEMTALDQAGVFEYKPNHHKIPHGYQYAPLRMIFEVKQEDL